MVRLATSRTRKRRPSAIRIGRRYPPFVQYECAIGEMAVHRKYNIKKKKKKKKKRNKNTVLHLAGQMGPQKGDGIDGFASILCGYLLPQYKSKQPMQSIYMPAALSLSHLYFIPTCQLARSFH